MVLGITVHEKLIAAVKEGRLPRMVGLGREQNSRLTPDYHIAAQGPVIDGTY
jgi:hypothetical protein